MQSTIEITTESFGSRIKRIREKLGLSKIDLARKIGHKDSKMVKKWENDEAKPNRKSIQKLSEALKVKPNKLISSSGIFSQIYLPDDISQNPKLLELLQGLPILTENDLHAIHTFYKFRQRHTADT